LRKHTCFDSMASVSNATQDVFSPANKTALSIKDILLGYRPEEADSLEAI
jgi:hypothetical protein